MDKRWNYFKELIKGKVFLIGLTFIDHDEKIIEEYQTSGIVNELTDKGIFKFIRTDGSIFSLPYEPESIKPAAKGEYREKSTNNIIIDPDFITTWIIKLKSSEETSEIKREGFQSRTGSL